MFDSGVGGLTVLHELMRALPREHLIYFGDTGRYPYGTKSAETVGRYAIENTEFLLDKHVKLLVVACNTMASVALDAIADRAALPVVGVIHPGAVEAVRATRNRRVGLLATEATVASGRYEALMWTADAGVTVVPVACPRLVPLIESDDPFGEETVAAVRAYAAPLKEADVDTVVLGCTHYPLLAPAIAAELPGGALVDSASAVAADVRARFGPSDRAGEHRFFVTDAPERFLAVAGRFLGRPVTAAEHVDV